MKRPEKKVIPKPIYVAPEHRFTYFHERGEMFGYNQACDDWEAFLPDEKWIYRFIVDNRYTTRRTAIAVAKAISKRLRGEE